MAKAWNYLSTITSRDSRTGEPVERGAFMDRLCSAEDGFFEQCRDLSREYFTVKKFKQKHRRLSFFLPPSTDTVPFAAIETVKEYQLEGSTLSVRWTFANRGAAEERFYFIPEINLSFQKDDDTSLRLYTYSSYTCAGEKSEKTAFLKSGKTADGIQAVELNDVRGGAVMVLHSGDVFNLRFFPVRTKFITNHTKKEMDFYQFSCMRPSVYIELESGAQRTVWYNLNIQ
jgi:hypothetical protein